MLYQLWAANTAISLSFGNFRRGEALGTRHGEGVTVSRHRSNTLCAEFLSAASSALSAEKDELIHKQVLDTALGQASIVQNANSTLVLEGTFQMVVDLLQDIASNGVSRIANVDKINNVRCPRVLPAIDAYFAAAARQVKKGPQVLATFPKACRKG